MIDIATQWLAADFEILGVRVQHWIVVVVAILALEFLYMLLRRQRTSDAPKK